MKRKSLEPKDSDYQPMEVLKQRKMESTQKLTPRKRAEPNALDLLSTKKEKQS